jgi:hypothetical protein
VVHVVRSSAGGYSQGGPNVSGEPGATANSQTSYVNNWLTWYPGLKVPTVPDTGALPTRVLDAINSVLPTGWSEARSTTATYWNSSSVESTASSNVLRLDYAAGTPVGYLIESAATNILQQSGSQGNAYWFASGVSVTATNISDPSGGTTASTLNMGNGSGPAGAVWADHVTVSANTAYTFSAWVKSSASGGGSFIRLTTNNASAFNTGISKRFPVTSTWTRISITGNVSNATVANIGFDNRDVTGTYDGTVSGNIDVWGAQLELGSTLTSYIPTTTATVTRGADVASFTLNSSATQLTFTFDDSSTQVITGLTGGSTYSIPTNLNRARILYIDDNTIAGVGSVGSAAGTGAATAVGVSAAASVGSAAGSGDATAGVVAWNASDKNSDVTLSSDGLTAVHSGATSQHEVVRGNTEGVAGRYFETVFTTIDTSGSTSLVGLANSSQSLSSFMQDPNGIGYAADGFADGPGAFSSGNTTFGVNDVIGVELLSSSAKIYKNGTLIYTFLTLPSGSLYPALSLYVQNDTAVTNFGAKAFSYLPAGDVGWDGLTPSAGNVGSASGSGAASGVGASTANSVGASSGTGAATAVGRATAASVGSATGSATVTAVGASTAASVGSSAGSGAATAVGASTARSVGSVSGSGAATATGASTAASVGSSAGAATTAAVGASTAASVGSSTGTGAATAKSISSAVGSAAGTGSASAVGASTALGVGSAAGTETVTAVGAATDASVGSSAGSSTASAVGASTARSVGASAGSGAATAVGAATAAGIGSSAGSATAAAFTGIVAQAAGSGSASGIGRSTVAAVGSAVGSATVTAASSSASAGSAAGTGTASAIGASLSQGDGLAAGAASVSGIWTGVAAAVGLSTGTGSASATSPAVETTIVSATGTAAGSSTSIGYAPSIDFSDDFGDDFANQRGTLPEQLDFGDDFSDDFAVRPIARPITNDFGDDFSNDFAVFHGIQRIVSGVGVASGASIVSGSIFAITAGTLPPDVEPPPPVYPPPPPPVPLVWHLANEYRRVQPPRANRVHRTGTELRRSIPRSMKRRYG